MRAKASSGTEMKRMVEKTEGINIPVKNCEEKYQGIMLFKKLIGL